MADQGLFIHLRLESGCSHVVALRSLLASGWRPDDHGMLRYLPIGDDEDYDWDATPASNLSSVMTEVETKARNGETIGIVLTFQSTLIGGEWLFFPNGDVAFSPSVNRKLTDGHSHVDWYLDRVLSAFARAEAVNVESWRWEETP